MENHHLLRPLLSPSTAPNSTTRTPPMDDRVINNIKLISSNPSIILRLSLVVFVGIVAVWASHEASKGYAISIVNESGDTFSGKRFQLFYVSNGEATRIVIKASKIIEDFLYPDYHEYHKKQINHITLKLARRNLTSDVVIESGLNHGFVLNVSPSILGTTNFRHAMYLVVRQGMARVWLWDGQHKAPVNFINGIVEYMTHTPDLSNNGSRANRVGPLQPATACWKHHDSRVVAEFLDHCERRRPGFVRRLNQAMRDGWDDGMLGGVLGQPVENICTAYDSLRYNFSSV